MPAPDTARTEHRENLLAATEDRPEHRAFVDHLLAAAEHIPVANVDRRWDALNEASTVVPRGVSDAAANALTEDLMWILADSYRRHAPQFPGQYRKLRLRGARVSRTRRERTDYMGPAVIARRLSFLDR